MTIACGSTLAQTSERDPAKAAKKPREQANSQPPRSAPSPAELQQRKLEEQRSAQRRLEERQLRDERRLERQRQDKDPRQQRARERAEDGPPVNKPHRVSPDAQPPKGPPSPAAQQQTRPALADDGRRVRCHALPVCRSGGYGGCRGVESTFSGNLSASRRDIVRQCLAANTPDSCDCAPQCSRVAQCSNI